MKRTFIFSLMLLPALAAHANDEIGKLPSSIEYQGIQIPIVTIPVGEIRPLVVEDATTNPYFSTFCIPPAMEETDHSTQEPTPEQEAERQAAWERACAAQKTQSQK